MCSNEAFSSTENHRKALEKLCRLCGKKNQSQQQEIRRKIPKKVSSYVPEIKDVFGVDVTKDCNDLHPKSLCNLCYYKFFYKTKHLAYTWATHPDSSDNECEVCNLLRQQAKGGRPRKPLRGRAVKSSQVTPDHHFLSMEDESDSSEINVEGFTPVCPTHICPLCNNFLKNPVEAKCNHIFCLRCIKSLFTRVTSSISCPVCEQDVHFTNIQRAAQYFQDSLAFACFECTTCKAKVSLDQTKIHKCTSSPGYKFSLFQNPPNDPLTPRTERLGTLILKRKLALSSDGITAPFKTGGQKMVMICAPQARVQSNDASFTTKRRRTRALVKTRQMMSGCHGEAVQTQLTDEIKQHQCQFADHQILLNKIALNTIRIPNGSFLPMKAGLGLSWKKSKEIKRWLKQYGVLTEGEGSLRKQGRLIIGDNIIGEKLPFLFNDDVNGGKVVRPSACISVKSLTAKIIQQQEKYDQTGKLTWHDGVIPNDTIWIKIGGDKGGHSFKQMFQVGNVEKPNALTNTVVVCAFEADDSIFNLELGLNRHKEQLSELLQTTWRNYKFQVFIFGDYQYLCRMYGITGASGRHGCLYCNVTKNEMQLPKSQRSTIQLRTLQLMADDLSKFKLHGCKPAKAKEHNNVIRKPILPIPLTHVCPPGLHISLGVFLKHYVSFENACHVLDINIGQTLASTESPHQESDTMHRVFQEYITSIHTALSLEQEANACMTKATALQDQLSAIMLGSDNLKLVELLSDAVADNLKKHNMKKSAAEAVRKKCSLKTGQGPVTAQLDKTLQEIGVHRQAYHGNAFVGNHVHRCCKAENIKKLTSAVVNMVHQLCPSAARIKEAEAIAHKYERIFTLFSRCHNTYNLTRRLNVEEIQHLDCCIKEYMDFFRTIFSGESVTPKMHLLEEHVVPWISQWKVGLGFHGEQGGESIHARFNNIRNDVRGLKDEVAILQSVMSTHWIQTNPM